jgi:hypothetical protein
LLFHSVEHPFATRRNGEAVIRRFLKRGDAADVIGGEAQELDGIIPRRILCRHEINTATRDGNILVVTQSIENLGGFATFYGDLSQAGRKQGLGVIEKPAIRRFEWRIAAIFRHLDSLAAVR